MCTAISLARSSLPTELIGRHGLEHRFHERGGEVEIHFYVKSRKPCLPIFRHGQFQIVPWGNRERRSKFLPREGWTWQQDINAGMWQNVETEFVDIPASLALERGVWYAIHEGIRGLLVRDENGFAMVYMICEPSSRYYKNMTRSDRMPVLIGQRIA